MYEHGMTGWGMGIGWLVSLLLVVVVVYFIKDKKAEEPSVKDILDKRYANGEIDTKEYQIRLEVLQKDES